MKIFKIDLKDFDIPAWLYYTGVLAILTLSFFKLSLPFNAHYDSDSAVQVLMADDFNFRTDWYYWGQSRFGSFIPLVGFFIRKVSGMDPAWAVTLANLLALLGAFWIFSIQFSSRFSRLLLCSALFLPFFSFFSINQIGYVFPSQLLFLGIVFYGARQLENLKISEETQRRAAAYAALIALFSALAVWMSEYSVPFLAVAYLRLLFRQWKDFKALPFARQAYVLLPSMLVAGAGAFLIYQIKYTSPFPSFSKRTFMEAKEIRDIIFRIIRFSQTELQVKNLSFYQLVPLLLLAYALRYGKAVWQASRFYVVLFVLGVFPVIILHWVYINEHNYRYFATAYFFLWMALIPTAERNAFRAGWLAVVACLQVATLYQKQFDPPARFQRLKAFETLGYCGIIGDYWSSYNIAGANFGRIVASPHPFTTMRNRAVLDSALNREKIFLISNKWLNEFPDTMMLHSAALRKVPGTKRKILDYELCQYQRYDWTEMVFSSRILKMRNGKLIKEDGQVYWAAEAGRSEYVCMGPLITLEKGRYRVEYNLSVQPLAGLNGPFALLAITAEKGSVLIDKKQIDERNMQETIFTFELDLKESRNDVEFRISNMPSARLKIKQVRLVKI